MKTLLHNVLNIYFHVENTAIATATCRNRNNQAYWDWDISCGGNKTMQGQLANVLQVSTVRLRWHFRLVPLSEAWNASRLFYGT